MKRITRNLLSLALICIFTTGAFGNNALLIEPLYTGLRSSPGDSPLSGGRVYICNAGMTCPGNPQVVWLDGLMSYPSSQPIILDEYGRATIFANGVIKIVVYDSNGVLVPYPALDNYRVSAATTVTNGADSLAYYLLGASDVGLTHGINIGALGSGTLLQINGGGLANITTQPFCIGGNVSTGNSCVSSIPTAGSANTALTSGSATTASFATTAGALNVTPSNCGTGNAATGIQANGSPVGCFTPFGGNNAGNNTGTVTSVNVHKWDSWCFSYRSSDNFYRNSYY